MNPERKIIHIDMDAFYPSVEVLDNPELQGRALIVGGDPNSRGVVASASYEARKFGVRSAMACSLASKRCPQAIFLRPRMQRYREISHQIHAIFARYTDLIEPISLDEAWLDVTQNFHHIPSATWLAQRIKREIKNEIHLTCSAGVSFNKFLAKIASDERKPDGLFVITPTSAPEFLQRLPVRKIPGVGKVTQRKLQRLGIEIGAQLQELPENVLVSHFGKMGSYLYHIIRGDDPREVVPSRDPKSISTENTFADDFLYGPELQHELRLLAEDLQRRLARHSTSGQTLTLKVKFHDFQQITRSMTQAQDFQSVDDIYTCADHKLQRVCFTEFPQKPIRLLGIGVSKLSLEYKTDTPIQLDFFDLFYGCSELSRADFS